MTADNGQEAASAHVDMAVAHSHGNCLGTCACLRGVEIQLANAL